MADAPAGEEPAALWLKAERQNAALTEKMLRKSGSAMAGSPV
jgi:hypothetical protein